MTNEPQLTKGVKNGDESSGLGALSGKYLTFAISKESYGIDIRKVKEIIGVSNLHIISVPDMPAYAQGVINLRDKVIPVFSLRSRFGFDEMEFTDRTCIIVTEIEKGEDKVPMGVVVDSVSEVLNVVKEQIEPPPEFGGKLDSHFVLGMAKIDGSLKILLDIDRVLNAKDVEKLAKTNVA